MKEVSYKELELNPFTSIGEETFLLCTQAEGGRNIMTVGWASLGYLWKKPIITVYVRPTRYTYELMEKSNTFSCVFLKEDHKKALNYAGTASGRNEDKIKGSNLTIKEIIDEKTGKKYFTFKEACLTLTCTKAYAAPIEEKYFVDKEIDKNYPRKDYHIEYVGYIDGVFLN